MRYPAAPAVLILATLLHSACSPAPDSGSTEPGFRFAAVVDFQQHQLSTDLISVPEQIGLDVVGHGWWQERIENGGEDCLRLAKAVGRLELFSADGDLEQIELELKGDGLAADPPNIQIRFNGERLDRFAPPADWTNRVLDLPPRLVREGVNILEVAQRYPKDPTRSEPVERICVRRVRARSSNGRVLWPGRPQRIAAASEPTADGTMEETIEIPVAGFVELVFTVPTGARLRGRVRFDSYPPSRNEPAYLYVQMLDDTGAERTLFHERRYKTRSRWSVIDLDLSSRQGRLVRLRIGTTGAGNGVSRWQDLRIVGDQTNDQIAPLPPIERRVPSRSAHLGRPDVLLVLLDAARADGFSVFGGPHPTPAVERLARDGTSFTNAVSPSPWTGQSVPSILTGLFPDTLGVGGWGSRLPEGVPTLAELLAAEGYRTVLWTQHPFYANHRTFRRGFEEYYRSPEGAYEVIPTSNQLLADERPTFALVHLIPPHAPYEPPAPFRGAYSSWYRGEMSVDARHLNSFSRRRSPDELRVEDRRYAFDRYLENVAFADHLVGKILALLDREDRYEDTLVILLSDHGEAFLEHGRFLHTVDVHREMLHVPLIFKWPVSTAERDTSDDTPVSLVDIVPTLVDGLDLGNGEGFQGISLLPGGLEYLPANRPIYAMTRGSHDPGRPPDTKLMLEIGGWRALIDVDTDRVRLFRSDIDPGESENLASEQPLRALLLRQAAAAQWFENRHLLRAAAGTHEPEELDPEVEEQLRALGYLD